MQYYVNVNYCPINKQSRRKNSVMIVKVYCFLMNKLYNRTASYRPSVFLSKSNAQSNKINDNTEDEHCFSLMFNFDQNNFLIFCVILKTRHYAFPKVHDKHNLDLLNSISISFFLDYQLDEK